MYSLLEKENCCYLLNGNEIVSTPNGVKVSSHSKELMERLVEDANETDGDFTSDRSLLCYHYSTLDQLNYIEIGEAEPDNNADKVEHDNEVRDQWYMWLLYDPFLMLGQDSPSKQAIAGYFIGEIAKELDTVPVHIRTAFQVIINSEETVMLPHYIISRIINGENSIEENTELFLDCMEEHFEEYGFGQFDRSYYKKVIDTFVFYCCIPEDLIK